MACPLCKVDHGGPCPRLPTPPTSVPLARLTGWLPPLPKPPESEIERQMRIAILQPAALSPTLRDFLLLVYGNRAIMQGPNDVAGKIYDLYSESGPGAVSLPDAEMAKKFFLAVWHLSAYYHDILGGRLQYTRVKLERMAEACESPTFVPHQKYLTDFLYFDGVGKAVCRLYMNVKLGSIPLVLGAICKYKSTQMNHGVGDFKAACPLAAPGRADSIVVYCGSKDAATRLGMAMLQQYPDVFNAAVPGMTTRLDPNLGVSLGAEPEWQATGMEILDGMPEDAQSFGSIRCQLIAMAIANYNDNKAQFGSSFDVFSRFVCTAFKGYGLNPMQPGD